MIWNIIDRRKRQYRWNHVNVIIEATFHDNSVDDSDQAPVITNDTHVIYEQREGITVADAIKWAAEASCPVTLYIYDEGDGTTVRKRDADQSS